MTHFIKTKSKSIHYYTPITLTKSLGKFDLDPCTSKVAPWYHAKINLTRHDDGLSKKWKGRVWMNPPFGRNIGAIDQWLDKLSRHKDGGTALVPATPTVLWFHQFVFQKASGIFFPEYRIRYYNIAGELMSFPNVGTCLVSFGKYDLKKLAKVQLKGELIEL